MYKECAVFPVWQVEIKRCMSGLIVLYSEQATIVYCLLTFSVSNGCPTYLQLELQASCKCIFTQLGCISSELRIISQDIDSAGSYRALDRSRGSGTFNRGAGGEECGRLNSPNFRTIDETTLRCALEFGSSNGESAMRFFHEWMSVSNISLPRILILLRLLWTCALTILKG